MPCNCWARPSTCWSRARTPLPPSSAPTTITSPRCGAPFPPSARTASWSGCWGYKSWLGQSEWLAAHPRYEASDGDQTPACDIVQQVQKVAVAEDRARVVREMYD